MSLSFGYDQIPEQAFSLAGEAGIGWVRAVLNWNLVEPAPGRYDWIWITETGYPSNPAEQELPQYQGGHEAQARWLKDTIPYLFQLGAARAFWFQLIDNPRQAPRRPPWGCSTAMPSPRWRTTPIGS
ncbi:hypothetical protein [Pelomicrobium methylotrophicum]|uniref:Glycoside hydrolase family 42 N-terminal domain-containing protein n=1 Tax=Pelomicrobium methylotrophicum TaxID=2602750 RepID=A0A5C7EED0_9PROT|nr:hypothetical protein [Pelomicrobium methylotrophicum]TXF09888.1 hypothetical protein FR698_16430 [Pelomicrobium methylotrophicum]